jgi:hypothetical protein
MIISQSGGLKEEITNPGHLNVLTLFCYTSPIKAKKVMVRSVKILDMHHFKFTVKMFYFCNPRHSCFSVAKTGTPVKCRQSITDNSGKLRFPLISCLINVSSINVTKQQSFTAVFYGTLRLCHVTRCYTHRGKTNSFCNIYAEFKLQKSHTKLQRLFGLSAHAPFFVN